MAVVTINSLKTKWITDYEPTQADYVDLFDTLSNLSVILGASAIVPLGTNMSNANGFGITFGPSSLRFHGNEMKFEDLASPDNLPLKVNFDGAGRITTSVLPLTYIASITQTGTDIPALTERENTVGEIVFTRVDVGTYRATLTGAFVGGKVDACITNTNQQYGLTSAYIDASASAPDSLEISTFKFNPATGVNDLSDDVLAQSTISILVYP